MFLWTVIAAVGFGGWAFSGSHPFHVGDISWAAKSSGGAAVQGASSVSREDPVSFESRHNATQFVPQRKPNAPGLAVPNAHASVILDVDSGKVLYASGADQERQIASLTKMMTALMTVERIKNLDEPVTISEDAIYAEGTRVGCPRSGYCIGNRLKVGERVTVYNLLKAALMNSANDAAISLGEHLGGSQDGFAVMMNARAKELGLEHTHFCTPSGLEPDGRESECYSSAADVARIASEALKHDVLWQIMRLPDATITSCDGSQSHNIFNTDKIIGQVPDLIGTKTGFTPLAGYSLLAAAYDPSHEHRVVAVVLDDSQRWQDIQTMLHWAVSNHSWQ
jgi:D-alanyl-D-alanine carboxypeptidase